MKVKGLFPFQLVLLLLLLLAPIPAVNASFFDLVGELLDLLIWGKRPIFSPFLQCGLRILLYKFEPQNFDRYEEYFRHDSVVRLAQTGQFQGPQGIREYVQFATSDTSVFFATGPNDFINQNRYDSYNRETNQCRFLQISRWEAQMDPQFTSTNTKVSITYMAKIDFDYRKQYVPRMDIFFSEQYMRRLFGEILSSAESRDYVCDVMEGPCTDSIETPDDCIDQLAALDGSSDVSPFRTDANYQGCRSLHSVFAAVNPTDHCPHISFTPFADPQNRVKCQTTLGFSPEDFFTAEELEEWRQFVIEQGIDPDFGYLEYD